jgi:hypothetical protein
MPANEQKEVEKAAAEPAAAAALSWPSM